MADHVQGLWHFAAAIGYAVVVLLANRYYGLTGASIAVAACLVVQFASSSLRKGADGGGRGTSDAVAR